MSNQISMDTRRFIRLLERTNNGYTFRNRYSFKMQDRWDAVVDTGAIKFFENKYFLPDAYLAYMSDKYAYMAK